MRTLTANELFFVAGGQSKEKGKSEKPKKKPSVLDFIVGLSFELTGNSGGGAGKDVNPNSEKPINPELPQSTAAKNANDELAAVNKATQDGNTINQVKLESNGTFFVPLGGPDGKGLVDLDGDGDIEGLGTNNNSFISVERFGKNGAVDGTPDIFLKRR